MKPIEDIRQEFFDKVMEIGNRNDSETKLLLDDLCFIVEELERTARYEGGKEK